MSVSVTKSFFLKPVRYFYKFDYIYQILLCACQLELSKLQRQAQLTLIHYYGQNISFVYLIIEMLFIHDHCINLTWKIKIQFEQFSRRKSIVIQHDPDSFSKLKKYMVT